MPKKMLTTRLESDLIDRLNEISTAIKAPINDTISISLDALEREQKTAETVVKRVESIEKNLSALAKLMAVFDEKMVVIGEKMDKQFVEASFNEKERMKSLLKLLETKIREHDEAEEARFRKFSPRSFYGQTMKENSYQGYEVQKHRAIMTGKMCFQIGLGCSMAQLILLMLLIHLHVHVPFAGEIELVPRLHRELALKWPIARLEQLVSLNKRFRLHAEGRLPSWPHDSAGIVEISAEDMIRNISYERVFTSQEAHWGRAVALSFLAWFCWPLAFRSFGKATVKM
jgi:hypothetical protein